MPGRMQARRLHHKGLDERDGLSVRVRVLRLSILRGAVILHMAVIVQVPRLVFMPVARIELMLAGFEAYGMSMIPVAMALRLHNADAPGDREPEDQRGG